MTGIGTVSMPSPSPLRILLAIPFFVATAGHASVPVNTSGWWPQVTLRV
jgi:hypothetical protein